MKVDEGAIFERDGSFYQVVKATASTVTVKPIESEFVGMADDYGWERAYMPKPGRFTTSFAFTDKQNEQGKRCKVRDYSADGTRPQIDVGAYFDAHLWDGNPGIFDTYN